MNDAVTVRVLHRITHLGDQDQTLAHVEPLFVRVAGQRDPLDELHGEIGDTVCATGHTGLVDVGDAGMVEATEDLRFPFEAGAERVGKKRCSQDLQRNTPSGMLLLRLVDDAHAATPQQSDDLVAAVSLAWLQSPVPMSMSGAAATVSVPA